MGAMTDLLSRPVLRVPHEAPEPDRPLALLALLGAAAVAGAGLLICLALASAGWFAADLGTYRQALGIGALGWLVANGAGLTGGGVAVGAAPLGATAAAAYALFRVGRWTVSSPGRLPLRRLGLPLAVLALGYGAAGALVSAVTNVGGVHAPLIRSAVACTGLGLVFGGLGLLRGSGLDRAAWWRLPVEARAIISGAAVGVLAMLGLSALLLTVSLLTHLSTAMTLAGGLSAGLVGGLIIGLVGLACVPNAVLWSGAFIAGPGFSVGTVAHVSPTAVHVGLLPDFPLLAALPGHAGHWWAQGLVVLPIVVGAGAGLTAVRVRRGLTVDRAALLGALAGLCGGVAFGLLTALATGGIGAGRLSRLGPDVLATTSVSGVALLVGGAGAAAGWSWLSRSRRTPDSPA